MPPHDRGLRAAVAEFREVGRLGGVTAPALHPNTVKRLAFVRLLYQQAVEQSYRAEPLNAFAVLGFHDAVELFLRLVGDHIEAQLPDRLDFGAYWGELKKGDRGVVLTSKGRMDRLNKVRVAFKHHGSEPGTAGVELARLDTTVFLETNTPLVFDMEFDRISMVDLVSQPEAKEMILDAEAAAATDDFVDAVAWTHQAFDWLINDYGSRKQRGGLDRSPYHFGPTIKRSHAREFRVSWDGGRPKPWLEKLEEIVNDHHEAIAAMQASLRVVSTGIDYRRYARFALLRPDIDLGWGDPSERVVRPSPYVTLKAEDYDFCRDFVITSAIHLAAEDFDSAPPE